ncbi:hypothetical protein AYR62_02985 [Secundilactobacillus paracollinoides]|uniref:acyltransferase n=1 Tax=Secundilactobacillus paracollinoides TaxID=240427 RepID=UPI0006CF5D3C|nr:acyltransferase [Secundilactobacillus paracollinoides]ANZ63161.1 hypothetical protein AYR62_02985 [Secundilactobacillus paracollinoides]KRL81210.1 hypothetical protein FC17_GL002343 [Secundilactobacillus paracollinoides DSM 15502 = JCM 11969]
MAVKVFLRCMYTFIKFLKVRIRLSASIKIKAPQNRWRGKLDIVCDHESTICIGKRCSSRGFTHLESIDGGKIVIGNDTFINRNVSITSLKSIVIGNKCLIANNVVIVDHDHNFYLGNRGFITRNVTIGNNVWIGANSVVLKGVQIAENVVVAAGSVVTKDIPKNSVVAGNPAVIIKSNTHSNLSK